MQRKKPQNPIDLDKYPKWTDVFRKTCKKRGRGKANWTLLKTDEFYSTWTLNRRLPSEAEH